MGDDNSKFVVNFKYLPFFEGCVFLFFLSIWGGYLWILSGYEIGLFLMSVFFFFYSIVMGYNVVDKVIFEEQKIMIKKRLKTYLLNAEEISIFNLLKIRGLGQMVILKIKLVDGKNIFGHYIYLKKEHDNLITYLKKYCVVVKYKEI